jgi:hypothetical protein
MMEAVRTSETSVDNHFTRQYIPEDNSDRGSNFVTSEEILVWRPAVLTEFYSGFSQSFQANAGIVPEDVFTFNTLKTKLV